MATQEQVVNITLPAGADLTAAQYLFAAVDSSGNAVLCGDGGNGIGVIQTPAPAGKAVTIQVAGVTKVKGGGDFSPGAIVSSGAAGVANAGASADYSLGIALDTGASGRISTILLAKNGPVPA